MKKILFVLFGAMIMLGLSLTSCEQNPAGEKATTGTETKTTEVKGLEKYLYSSADELDLLYSRGIGDIVDWTLARELAEIELEDMQLAGEFETTTFLREFPIAIYDAEGAIKYYEFRVCSEAGDAIGAITTVAKESEGYPIAFKLLFEESYSDSLELLFHQGKVSEDDMLRVVANDYPNYAIGVIESTRGENDVTELYASDNGESLTQEEIAEPVRLDMLLAENPELEAEVGAEAIAEMEAYKTEVAEFWSAVNPHKGTLRDVNTRGRTRTLEQKYISNWGTSIKRPPLHSIPKTGNQRKDYFLRSYWCGPTAVNYTLGYMNYKGMISYNSGDLNSYLTMRNAMQLYYTETWGFRAFNGATMPWKVDNGIYAITNKYKVLQSGWGLGFMRQLVAMDSSHRDRYNMWNAVRQSIRVDQIPGISLHGVWFGGKLVPHYRNVVGYKVIEKRWWFFRWKKLEMRIHDRNGRDNGWETYNALKHWQYYRITKK